MGRYRHGLRRVVAGAAIPYGYTIATWTSGGVLVQTHGPPHLGEALLFLAGAALGFAAAAFSSGSTPLTDEEMSMLDRRWVGVASAGAAAAALCVAAAVAYALDGAAAFGLVSLTETLAYLFVASVVVSHVGEI